MKWRNVGGGVTEAIGGEWSVRKEGREYGLYQLGLFLASWPTREVAQAEAELYQGHIDNMAKQR